MNFKTVSMPMGAQSAMKSGRRFAQKQLICTDFISANLLFQRHQRPIFRLELAKTVLKSLDSDDQIAKVGIDVVDRNGIVTLTGKVPGNEIKRKAEAITSKHDGVVTVINEIQVDPSLEEVNVPVLLHSPNSGFPA